MPDNDQCHTPDDRICVIMNASAGKRRGQTEQDKVMTRFAARGAKADLRLITSGDDIGKTVSTALREGYGTIVAAGGDGTIVAAATAMQETRARFGVIPFGTFNYFARSHGIPVEAEAAVDTIIDGTPRSLPLATLNGQVFLNNANFGIYPKMLARREANYARWGRSRIAAYMTVLTTLIRLPRRLHLTITTPDVRLKIKTPVAFVFSNAFQLQEMGLDGADCIRGGKLAVLLARNQRRWGLLKSGFALALGRATRGDDFSLICADRVTIKARRRRLRIAFDGERQRMRGPYEFRIHQDALTIITPNN